MRLHQSSLWKEAWLATAGQDCVNTSGLQGKNIYLNALLRCLSYTMLVKRVDSNSANSSACWLETRLGTPSYLNNRNEVAQFSSVPAYQNHTSKRVSPPQGTQLGSQPRNCSRCPTLSRYEDSEYPALPEQRRSGREVPLLVPGTSKIASRQFRKRMSSPHRPFNFIAPNSPFLCC